MLEQAAKQKMESQPQQRPPPPRIINVKPAPTTATAARVTDFRSVKQATRAGVDNNEGAGGSGLVVFGHGHAPLPPLKQQQQQQQQQQQEDKPLSTKKRARQQQQQQQQAVDTADDVDR